MTRVATESDTHLARDGMTFQEQLNRHAPCARCGGLMVRDICMDVLNSTSELDCPAARCVQCGEIVDPVILKNRQRQRDLGCVSSFDGLDVMFGRK